VWEDAISVDENEVYLVFQVHNEAITVPETIDAIRAMTGIETNGRKSIEKTDRALGITKFFLPSVALSAGCEGQFKTAEAALKNILS
jgi:glyceraldehyde-3-phosphate dehydrogenase (NAD(P))